MIPLFIIILWRNYRKSKTASALRLKNLKSFAMIAAPLMLALLSLSFTPHAQEQLLHYDVFHKGEIKGQVLIRKNITGKQVHIKIESEVKVRFLLLITVRSIEE